MRLTEENKKIALELLNTYLKDGEVVIRKKETLKKDEFQRLRIEVGTKVKDLLNNFLKGKIDLESFKREVDRINKRNELWGFKGIKGQMFFNQLYNNIEDKSVLTRVLKDALSLPKDIGDAGQKINNFESFVLKVSQDFEDKRAAPKPTAILYFLSYFWQITDKDRYPVFYTSMEELLSEFGLMQEIKEKDKYYQLFYEINNELRDLFEAKINKKFSYWDVEHVFWYRRMKTPTIETPTIKERKEITSEEDYIPPVIKSIPLLAMGDRDIAGSLEKENKKIEDVLEDKVYKLFIMLGYETERLGKGKGRVPDGIAFSKRDNYAIIYDTKSRSEGYGSGTDDRAIKEYINSYSNKLRNQGIRNIYFVIISGDFKGDYDETIRRIKMETDVKEVLLLKAELLLFILELKLKDSTIDLGQDGMQQVFAYSGVISKEEIQEMLVGW